MELFIKSDSKPKKQDTKLTVKDFKGGTPIKVENKDQLKQLREQYGMDHIIQQADEQGVKHDGNTKHKTFNYMKAAMAIGDHVASGKDFHVKKPFKPEKGTFHIKLK